MTIFQRVESTAFGAGQGAAAGAERRGAARMRIEIPALLRTASGSRPGVLADLSVSGARMVLDDPPRQGLSGMLDWDGRETFCSVVWSANGACGLLFERALPLALVLELTGQAAGAASTAPVANRANIPMGTRRARPGASAG